MEQLDIYNSATTEKANCDQRSHRQLTKLPPIKSTERSITLQQDILLAIICCIEDWDNRMKWMRTEEQAQKSDQKYLRRLRPTGGLLSFCTKVFFSSVYPSASINRRRVSRQPSSNIYVIPETPEGEII
ncbi:Serine protease inhibitor Kazal-type [Dirofilaria immitis]